MQYNIIVPTEEQISLVMDFRSKGKTYKQISEETGITDWVVRKIGHSNGDIRRVTSNHIDESVIFSLHEKGFNYREIAEKCNCSATTVQKHCKNSGRKRNLTSLQNKIIFLYNNGKSITEIAKIEGKRKSTISAIVRKFKLKKEKQESFRVCEHCKSLFYPNTENQKFCTVECQKKYSHAKNDFKRKDRLKNRIVDNDITLQMVYEKDKGICWLCGEICDWSSLAVINGQKKAKKMYPTIDHVIPLSKGGLHEWKNVRLAHLGCNASKGVKVV